MCEVHRKLHVFKFFTENIRGRNLNKNVVATKICIRDNFEHAYCLNNWCFEIYETKWVSYETYLQEIASKYL